ncbi:NUDIX hydrolase [Janibacter hoylei]|uniref:NUDIX hydrolase n=1 Tax=Janibacter hoylei TaxID=364298 RepID=UPI0027BA914C|nr:NUDIX domain-containing protein [Janibacter hoylei]
MTAVPVRPAVSVIPLRDGPAGPEVFVQHRQPTMDFAAGAVVFPGGRCDPGDEAKGAALTLSSATLVDHVHRWRHVPVAQDRQADARTLLATGLRELAEETGLVADPELLLPWDRWVTPEGSPKRFDVFFFVLPVPREHARQPTHLTTEAVGSEWTAIDSLLDAGEAGDLRLMTPTRVILRELLDLGTVAEVVRRRPVITGVRDDRPSARPRASDPV